MSERLAGGCLCGAIRFSAVPVKPEMGVCHCSMCRKAQGSAFGANIPVPEAQFTLTRGAEALVSYASTPDKKRCFCGTCGSPIYSALAGVPVVRLRAGSLDKPDGVVPSGHIFAASHATWHRITDDLPQHDEREPGR